MRNTAAALILLAGISPVFASTAFAQEAGDVSRSAHVKPSIIRLSGTGYVSVPPTLARISGGVTTTAETARDALTQNNAAMAKVLDALKADGVEPKDIMTSDFTISPQYSYDNGNNQPRQPKLIGYEVRNAVNVTVRDLKKLGAILDTTVTNGANTISNIGFDVENVSALQDDARKKAFEDARRKAQLLADQAQLKLGRVVSISESMQGGRPSPRLMMDAMKASAPESVPVEQGELNLSAQVNVEWELLP